MRRTCCSPDEAIDEAALVPVARRLADATGLLVSPMLKTGLVERGPTGQAVPLAIEERSAGMVARLRGLYGDAVVILVVAADLNDAPSNLNFVFAEHLEGTRVSVVSTARLGLGLPTDPDGRPTPEAAERAATRLHRLLLKTVGVQCLRLSRSTDITSAMYSPLMSLDDLDAIGERLP